MIVRLYELHEHDMYLVCRVVLIPADPARTMIHVHAYASKNRHLKLWQCSITTKNRSCTCGVHTPLHGVARAPVSPALRWGR